MLGYADVAPYYPYEMPREMAAAGYAAASIGKNHYYNQAWMPNATTPPPTHGWPQQWLYDGLGDGETSQEVDTYDRWFAAVSGGQDPLATGKPDMDWNSWRGAPYVYEEDWHPTAWVGSTARTWLANYSASGSEKPFFLKVSFHRPHSPYDPPARLLNATLPRDLPPVRAGGNWDADLAGPSQWCGPSDPDAWCGAMPDPHFTVARRAYRANIKFVDEQIGALLSDLDSHGLANNTWVLFVSDHGDGQGDHHLWRKSFPYEVSTHVPGILAWPRGTPAAIPAGASIPLLGELRDIFPTVLDLAGVPLPPGRVLNGSSWGCLALVDPSGAKCGPGGGPWRTTLDLEHSLIFNETNHWNSIVTQSGLKYIFRAFFPDEQLFNLTADPYELENVAGDAAYASSLASLRAILVEQFEVEGRGDAWVKNGVLQQRTAGQVYSPNFPADPPPQPLQPIIPGPPCTTWFNTSGAGGYYRNADGANGQIGPFSGLRLEEALKWCCASLQCAGFDWDFDATSGLGSGYYKQNALGGWTDSTVYVGYYKPGQVPGENL